MMVTNERVSLGMRYALLRSHGIPYYLLRAHPSDNRAGP
jgi:hypothetical protein